MWDQAKPSNIANKPAWMTFDDLWVEEVRRGLKACAVFLWYPLYCQLEPPLYHAIAILHETCQ